MRVGLSPSRALWVVGWWRCGLGWALSGSDAGLADSHDSTSSSRVAMVRQWHGAAWPAWCMAAARQPTAGAKCRVCGQQAPGPVCCRAARPEAGHNLLTGTAGRHGASRCGACCRGKIRIQHTVFACGVMYLGAVLTCCCSNDHGHVFEALRCVEAGNIAFLENLQTMC